MRAGFTSRLVLLLALLLAGFGALVALLGRQALHEQEQESLQRLSHGLARHIVEHWPAVTSGSGSDGAARAQVLGMLMVVNPGIQVYTLDADGRVAAYLGQPGMVRTPQVDLAPVRRFLAGDALPLRGTDPMGGDERRIFSVAMFPPQPGDARPPGYLYVLLESPARAAVAAGVSGAPAWQGAAWAALAGLVATLAVGALVLRRLTMPLNRLARRLGAFGLDAPAGQLPRPASGAPRDEVGAIALAFEAMALRVREQVREREAQASAHREMMANLAHDLRTPLTALHGQLEALIQADREGDPAFRARLLAVALGQSEKLRRLTQQLFELAMLQAGEQVLQRERFRLDELVADTVQKFELCALPAKVSLVGEPPGAVDFDGDLHLIERALTNLIDNAVRHAPGPVHVSIHLNGPQVTVLIEDSGPGLSAELARRLDAGEPVREPALHRPGGGLGGLGLAIAQRIATLHGGRLRTLPAPSGGARLALALPQVA